MLRQILVFSLPLLAVGQSVDPRFGIPSLGYTFDDSAKSLRLLSGIPGAALLDAQITLDSSLASAFVSSRGKVAIATLKSGELALVDWNGMPRSVALDTSFATISKVSFSRSGAFVAITDGTTAEIWGDLKSTPTRISQLAPEGGVQAVAVHDNGLAAIAGPTGVHLLGSSEPRLLLNGMSVTAAAFSAAGADLLVSAGGSVQWIRDVRKASGSSLAVTVEGEISGLTISTDGLWAAASLADDVALVNLSENSSTLLHCGCRMNGLDALTGNLVISATDSKNGSLMILDLGSTRALARIPQFGGSAQ